ncbi:hypothetical protein BGW38_006178, partial [Lunasporangiospora selenospora]
MDPSSSRKTNYTRAYQRAIPMEQKRSAGSSTTVYGSDRGPREAEHPCCTLGRLCLQALTG